LEENVSNKNNPKVKLKHFMPYRLNNLSERVSVALSRIYSDEFDISVAEWRILATLAEYPHLLAKEIGQQTHMDKVKVSRAVGTLDQKQCLIKEKDLNDSRAIRLALNAKGLTLYENIAHKALEWEKSLLAGLNGQQKKGLYELLGYLDERVSAMTKKG